MHRHPFIDQPARPRRRARFAALPGVLGVLCAITVPKAAGQAWQAGQDAQNGQIGQAGQTKTPFQTDPSIRSFPAFEDTNSQSRDWGTLYRRGAPGGRSSLAGWEAFSAQKTTESHGGQIHLGPANIHFALYTQLAFDSNINFSDANPIWDWSLTPHLRIDFQWPITRQNELEFQIGLEYRRYLFHPEYSNNGFFIDPGTILQYRIFTGDFVFTIYDAPQISTSPGDQPGIFNTVNFQQLTNSVGIYATQDLNKLISVIGVERQDTRSLSGTFTSSNNTSYLIYGNSFYSVTPTTRVGLRGTLSYNTYPEEILNDSVTALLGAALSSSPTKYTTYYLEAGVQGARFFNTGRQTDQLQFTEEDGFNENLEGTLGGGDYVQPYFLLQITNQLNPYYAHSLLLQREASGSAVSNYREINSFGYSGSWKVNRITDFSFFTEYQFGKLSAISDDSFRYSQWHSRADLHFKITRDTSVDFFYDYLLYDLSDSSASYRRSFTGMSVSWTF